DRRRRVCAQFCGDLGSGPLGPPVEAYVRAPMHHVTAPDVARWEGTSAHAACTGSYCGQLYRRPDASLLDVAAGTVFNEVVLYKVDPEVPVPACKSHQRLRGHEVGALPQRAGQGAGNASWAQGVILRVRFNESATKVASVSDDRSIRVWDLASG